MLCPPECAVPLWNALLAAGAAPAGLAARDTLRLEKGYSLSGQDFTENENPFEAGLGRVVKLDKPDFSGHEALLRLKAGGLRKRLVGLLPQGKRIPRHGAPVLSGGQVVGRLTSGGYSPCLERPIALAYLAPAAAELDEVDIDLGGKMIKALVTSRVFYPPK